MSKVIFNKDDIVKIDDKKIQELKHRAIRNPSGKTRFCLHKNIQESLHEMIIVLRKGIYVRPHKHKKKSESFHIIRGSFFVIIFDKNGKEIERILLSKKQSKSNFLCRLDRNIWHMVIPISDFVVFHETTKGPFVARDDSVFASWAPKDDDHIGIKKFIEKLLNNRLPERKSKAQNVR